MVICFPGDFTQWTGKEERNDNFPQIPKETPIFALSDFTKWIKAGWEATFISRIELRSNCTLISCINYAWMLKQLLCWGTEHQNSAY